MKKRFFDTVVSAVVAAVMLSSLAACGGGGGETTPVGDETVFDTQQETTSQQTTQSNEVVATIEETVMWDNEDIKVTALNLTSNQYYHILNLRIENKTGRDLYVMASRTAVNSFVVEPIMGADVPANSTVEDEFKIWLKDVDAKVIADIETRFSYSSSDRYLNRTTERVKLETSAAASHDYSYDESGTVLYDADGIKIICQGFSDEGNPMIYLSSTGELSEGCCVEAYKVYVNGKETYASYCEWVFTNTRNVAELELDDEDRDGNELGEVERLEVSFKINKENMADRSPVRTELVEIPVK
jgi:predicted small lipoprotein YifL